MPTGHYDRTRLRGRVQKNRCWRCGTNLLRRQKRRPPLFGRLRSTRPWLMTTRTASVFMNLCMRSSAANIPAINVTRNLIRRSSKKSSTLTSTTTSLIHLMVEPGGVSNGNEIQRTRLIALVAFGLTLRGVAFDYSLF